MKYDLSIIIPSFNSEQTILESIDSILLQNLSISYEVIIVDDCSTDNSLELIRNKIRDYKNFKVYKNKSNLGGGATRNIAISKTNSNIIYCLDSDNMIGEKSLEKMYYLLKENDLDAVTVEFSQRFYDKLKKGSFKWQFDTYDGELIPFEAMFSLNDCPLNITFMHTKRVFEITGGYPENHGFDTQHFAVKFLTNNLKAKVCIGAFDYHRLHSKKNSYYHREFFSGKSNYNWLNIYSEIIHLFNEKTYKDLVNFNFYKVHDISLSQKISKNNLIEGYQNFITNNTREIYRETLKNKPHLSSKDIYFLFHYEKELLTLLSYGIKLHDEFEDSFYLENKIIEILEKLGLKIEKLKKRSFKKITLTNRILNKLKILLE
jgi:glycosyltransferase involved in cell wall biosynthesis